MANTAAHANLKTAAFGVYGERRFMLEELSGYAAIGALPVKGGAVGLQADYFGANDFNESQLGLFYARKVSDFIDLGVKFNYHSTSVSGYGRAAAVTIEAGTIFHLTEKLHTGFHIYNPGGSNLGKSGQEKLASIYKAGAGYELSKEVLLALQIIKVEDLPVDILTALQYNLSERFIVKTGISTGNKTFFAGVGLSVPFALIHVNTSYHPYLGFTPGVLFIFNLKSSQASKK